MRFAMKQIIKNTEALFFTALILFSTQHCLLSQTGWYPLQSGTSNVLNSVQFINANTGFMSGGSIVLKTQNGGTNWTIISSSFGGSSVFFINENTGFVCNGLIYRTTNGGTNWTSQNFSLLNSVYFINELTGYTAGQNSQILFTADGGLNWFQQEVPANYNNFNKVRFITPNIGFAIGGRMYFPYYGVIFKTSNAGANWVQVDPSAQDIEFTGISFPTPTTGYLVGRYEYGSSGVIYKTTDAGSNWEQLGIYFKDLNDVYFPSENVGYAVGEEGTILKTVDGSSLWTSQQSNTGLDINSVYFLHDNLGYTAGNSGTAQKTQNGGISGPPFAVAGRVYIQGNGTASSGYVKALKYNASTNTVVVIDSSIIETTGDYLIRNVTRDTIYIAAFPDDEDIIDAHPTYVPTYYGGVNTGTINWLNAQKIYVNNNIFNIDVQSFPIVSHVAVNSVSGWVYSAPPNINPLKDAIVYAKLGNQFYGYGVSRAGGVYDVNNLAPGTYTFTCDRMGYRSVTKDTTLPVNNVINFNFYLTLFNPIGISQIGTDVPAVFRLEQNYPNPFNPSTNIKFSVPERSAVKLVVYDMLGKQLDMLINEELSAGIYKVTWNAAKYSSGIYFYRVIAKGFTDTKKMIVVK
jgi:photosystem II stability/assembly factor-like uncharacterized protein